MKNNLFVNILFLFMAIPLVFLSVNFYLGTQDYAIEQFNNHALSVICGRLCLVSIVLSIIILVCLVIDLFFNIYKKTKKKLLLYVREVLFMYSVGIVYALVLLLLEFLTDGFIVQNTFWGAWKCS